METRAMAIAFCYAIGTAAGRIAGPLTASDAGPLPQPPARPGG
jgi:hypothetical protein